MCHFIIGFCFRLRELHPDPCDIVKGIYLYIIACLHTFTHKNGRSNQKNRKEMVRTVFMEHLFSCKKNNKIKNLIEKEIFITLIRWISICSNTHTYAELSKMCRETNNTKIFVNSKHARMTCDNIEFGSFTCAVIRCVHLPIADSMKPSHFWQLVNCYTHTHTHALAHSLNSLFVGLFIMYFAGCKGKQPCLDQ